MKDFIQRKQLRLPCYDYSQNGCYFVTICTHDRLPLLGNITTAENISGTRINLTAIGVSTESIIKSDYQNTIKNYIIMPNHIHMLIELNTTSGHKLSPLQDVMRNFKSLTTRYYNEKLESECVPLWQRNYYEHVVRNEKELIKILEYIENNPLNWALDEYNIL